MSIATEITALQTNLSNAYTKVSQKGGTLPAAQNLSNLTTAIDSIPTTSSTKYGFAIDNVLGNVDANGVLQQPTGTSANLVFTGVKDLMPNVFQYKFQYNTSLTQGVSFPDLETLSKTNSCYFAFGNATGITSASFPSLESITGYSVAHSMFRGCTGITSVSFPELTTISGTQSCYNMFGWCSGLVSITFPSLSAMTGNQCCMNMFQYCTNLETVDFLDLSDLSGTSACLSMFYQSTKIKSISFPALTSSSFGSNTNQFYNMLLDTGTSVTHTLHFPNGLESTIQGLDGYPLFGGTSGYVTLVFDL